VGRRSTRGALAAAALLAAAAAGAQGGDTADGREGVARVGAVLLRLRPRAGDTVRTRFEQTVRLFEQGAGGPARAAGMAGTMLVLAHSVVERVDAAGALVISVTDSVVLRASGASPQATEQARRGMQGRRARLRVGADGATAVLGADAGRAESTMKFPAALPAGAVTPGTMWARAMTVPWGGPRAAPGAGGSTIDVWFRFDSLARGGTLAYLSLRGTVHGAGRRRPGRGAGEASSVNGAIVVDLARGWVVDSRTTFQLDGAITAPGVAPRPARVVVTQRLRVL
jgi:hypothetical protein